MPRLCLPARPGRILGAGMLAAAVLGSGITTSAAAVPADAPARASAPAADHGSDLRLSIRRLTPGAVPESGPIRIRGTVTNTSEETWSGISVFPFMGGSPMTSTSELAAAAETEPTAVVGQRITDVVHIVEELAPGESAPYSLRVPRRLINVRASGVYWFGVHALGGSASTPHDNVADGRARTFLPYIPEPPDEEQDSEQDESPVDLPADAEAQVDTAIVVPLRHQIDHSPRGQVSDASTWSQSLTNGVLRRAVDFGAAAGNRPVTWLLDPAVPDAVEQLRIGNPIRFIGPSVVPEGGKADDADPQAQDLATADTALARASQAWLEDAQSALRGAEVMLLPYGDLDLAAAGQHAPELYPLARERTGALVQKWGLGTTPAVGSPSGYLNEAGLGLVDDNALVVLTDRMFPEDEYADGAPTVVDVDGRRAVVTSYGAATGGPGPDRRRAPVALRQRVLAEAAARLLSAADGEDPAPLVMQLPPGIGGANSDRFWDGLDEPWLNLTTAAEVAEREPAEVSAAELTYPRRQVARELDSSAFTVVDRIREQAPVLQRLLTLNGTIADRLLEESLVAVSYDQRDDQERTIRRLGEISGWAQRRLEGVSIATLPGVTLSSDSGGFAVTLRNQLNEPVTVGVQGDSDGAFVDPVDPVVVPADGHVTVPLMAHIEGPGVHNLVIELTDAEGTPLGVESTVPIRSGQVGVVIWGILGAGGAILVVAIALRLVRRIRRGPESETADPMAEPADPMAEPPGAVVEPAETREEDS